MKDVQQRQDTERVPTIKERDKLLLEQEKMGERFTPWADQLDVGKIDEEQFDRQNARLLAQKKTLQTRLFQLDEELSLGEELEVSMDAVRQALNDFSSVWKELELEEQRELLRLLIEELKVFETHIELKLLFLDPTTIPWPSIMGRPKLAAKTGAAEGQAA